jgi:hypothetical protein
MDIDTMVENHFKKNRDVFGFESIAQLIEEVMDSMEVLGVDTKLLREVDAGGGTPESDTFDWNAIPEIGISELGWSDTRTRDSGGVPTGQRQVLMKYLEKIATGATLEAKIAELNSFMENPDMGGSGGAAQVVGKVMSYLVFLKTLTRVITNFNASSAGFSFESFIAVLMGGAQIKTGSQTIADFEAGGEFVSLKLYSEAGVEIGGSWQDLIDDLADKAMNNRMVYLVVLKKLEGEGLEQNGTLTFYQFVLTLENIANFVAGSGPKHRAVIILPLDENGQLVKAGAGEGEEGAPPEEPQTLAEAVGRPRVTAEQLEEKRQEILAALFKDALQIPEVKAIPDVQELPNQDSFAFGGPVFKKPGAGNAVGVRSVVRSLYKGNPEVYEEIPPDPQGSNALKRKGYSTGLLRQQIDNPDKPGSKIRVEDYIAKLITKAAVDAVEELRKGPEAARVAAGKELYQYLKEGTVEASVEYYNGLQSDAERIEALHSTLGYLQVRKFSMGKGVLTGKVEGVDVEALGVLKIGAMNILPILEKARGELNDQVFSIFTHLKTLSTSLNAYFASGLTDAEAGEAARKASGAIAAKTEEAVKEQPASEEGP